MKKIAIVQFQPALGDVDETMKRLETLLEKSKEADFVVLPELANSGYNFKSKAEALKVAESVSDSSFVSFLQEKCKTYGFHIISGFCEKENECLYNSAILVGAEGLKGTYRKLHLFWDEKDIFESGDLGLPVFDVDGITIGMLVCFDWTFPEVWRILAQKGAQLIAHPSNLVLPGFAQSVVPGHAIINRVFVATANRIGTEGELTFTGNSIVVNPKGVELVRGSAKEEEVLMVEFDPQMAHDKMITPRNHSLDDRRTDVYQLKEVDGD
ncbi:carbon-nitrogen hydrolase [Puteibacter caeruleilacunae]|nr:carbon-nitrogen hydrolase [Puteibacter caeruleilacunae]